MWSRHSPPRIENIENGVKLEQRNEEAQVNLKPEFITNSTWEMSPNPSAEMRKKDE
jgi:hypothetical protein